MKNGLFFTTLLLLAVSSFAQDLQNRYLFIEGTAGAPGQLDFFQRSFVMEANGCGYVVTNSRDEATHTLRYNVVSQTTPDTYEDVYDEYGNVYQEVYPGVEQYVISMSLNRNADNFQLITFDYAFTSIEEMYPFVRTLFLNSVTSIPLPILTEDYLGKQWNKWLYFRASFNYPVTFYLLQSDGLKGGIGLFNADPERVSPIGHEIMAMPGATLGIEFQPLNFLSLEANFQLSMGDTRNNYFVNMGVGVEVKIPIKLKNILLAPYGAFVYSLNVSPVFSDFLPFAVGPGVQLCARAGKRGIVFLDIQYLFSFRDTVMHNPYLAFSPEQQLYPEPAVIHYKRYYLGIGIGYKFGIIDKKKNTATITF